mmetsp:Transcript_112056/g.361883  ORF Transcript_112056/g.361883 Transcript_112056/m.361883 type:complete len:662 (+) Transcript_112056:486-2471(+)
MPTWLQVFFASQPKLDMKFAGLAAVAELPGIDGKLHAVVGDLLRNSIVLPNVKTIQLAKEGQIADLTMAFSQKPIGALRVQVVRAWNLAGANWQMGLVDKFSSDPYCVLRLGTSTTRTSTVRGSTSPAWPSDERGAYFPVYHHDQELEIEVRDDAQGGLLGAKFVTFLGRTQACKVRNLLSSSASGGRMVQRLVLDTSAVNSSMLHVNDPVNRGVPSELEIVVEWSNLEVAPLADALIPQRPVLADTPFLVAAGAASTPSDLLLMLELHSGCGFPERGLEKGLRWRCRWLSSPEYPVTSLQGTPKEDKVDLLGLPMGLTKNSALMQVIDRLSARRESIGEIAGIVGFDEEVVASYLHRTREFELRRRDHLRQYFPSVEVHWHQTVPLALPRNPEAQLLVELLEGEAVVGTLETSLLLEALRAGGAVGQQSFKVLPRGSSSSSAGGVGGWASWFFPDCGRVPGGWGVEAGRGPRFQEASMEVSARCERLVQGCYPATVGTFLHKTGAAGSQAAPATLRTPMVWQAKAQDAEEVAEEAPRMRPDPPATAPANGGHQVVDDVGREAGSAPTLLTNKAVRRAGGSPDSKGDDVGDFDEDLQPSIVGPVPSPSGWLPSVEQAPEEATTPSAAKTEAAGRGAPAESGAKAKTCVLWRRHKVLSLAGA